MNKQFESAKNATAIPNTADAEIIWHNVSFLQYEQIRLYALSRDDCNVQKCILNGYSKKPYQKLFELGISIITIL